MEGVASIQVSPMDPIPPDANPFCHDAVRMGTYLGKNVAVMYMNFPSERCKALVIVNMETGERIMLLFKGKEETKS